MAPVNDRGQLILVTGLSLAVALVALALVLNSAIYTENLASRDVGIGSAGAFDASHDVPDGLGGLMDGVNDPGAPRSYSELEDDYQESVREWATGSSQFGALKGESIRVAVATDGVDSPLITRGVRVADEDETTDFTPHDGTTTHWTVAPDVRARSLQLRVEGVSSSTDDSTVETALDSSNSWDTTGSFFFVDIDDGEWRMAVYGDGSGNVKVGVYDGDTDSYTVCSNTPVVPTVRINVGRGTINNVPCEALASVAKQSGPYDIHYANADQVTGAYELTVDRVVDGPSDESGPFTDEVDRLNFGQHCAGPTYYEFGGGFPEVAPALYASETDVSFRTKSVTYDSTVEVAADELAADTTSPQVTRFDVDDQSDGSALFVIEWAVADPDGDLSSVTAELVDPDDDSTKDQDSVNIGGERTASSNGAFTTLSLSTSASLPTEFDVVIMVEDEAGNTRSVTQRHNADGGDDTECPP